VQPTNKFNSLSKRTRAFGLLFLVLLLIVILLLFSRSSSLSYTTLDTRLNTHQNFGWISGENLLSFNGFSFHQTNLDSGDITVLHTGEKIPKPQELHWANSRGALITFGESFYGSLVDEELDKRNLSINSLTKRYTWYIDFKDKTVKLVSEEPILTNGAWYDETKNGFYFIEDYSFYANREDPPKNFSATALFYHDISTSNTTKIADNLRLTDITHIGPCGDNNYIVCVIGRSLDDLSTRQVFSVSAVGQKTSIKSAERLFHTSNPRYYIELVSDEREGENFEGGDYGESSIVIYDTVTKEDIKTGIRTTSSSVVTHINNEDIVLMVDDEEKEVGYYSGEVKEGGFDFTGFQILVPDNSGTALLDAYNSFGENRLLISTTAGIQKLVYPGNASVGYKNAEALNYEGVLTSCHPGGDTGVVEYYEAQRLFRVFFQQNNQLDSSLKTFGDCLHKSPTKLLSEQIYIGLTSPTNGRIISD